MASLTALGCSFFFRSLWMKALRHFFCRWALVFCFFSYLCPLFIVFRKEGLYIYGYLVAVTTISHTHASHACRLPSAWSWGRWRWAVKMWLTSATRSWSYRYAIAVIGRPAGKNWSTSLANSRVKSNPSELWAHQPGRTLSSGELLARENS